MVFLLRKSFDWKYTLFDAQIELSCFEKAAKMSTPALLLSRACQTPKVIHTGVPYNKICGVHANNINKPLFDGPVLSIMGHNRLELLRICIHGG